MAGGIVQDSNGIVIQAIVMPATGATINITSVVGSAASAAVLPAGLYRIMSEVNASVCAGATAASTDMPILAGVDSYFYFNGTTKLAAFCASAGSKISATLAG